MVLGLQVLTHPHAFVKAPTITLGEIIYYHRDSQRAKYYWKGLRHAMKRHAMLYFNPTFNPERKRYCNPTGGVFYASVGILMSNHSSLRLPAASNKPLGAELNCRLPRGPRILILSARTKRRASSHQAEPSRKRAKPPRQGLPLPTRSLACPKRLSAIRGNTYRDS